MRQSKIPDAELRGGKRIAEETDTIGTPPKLIKDTNTNGMRKLISVGVRDDHFFDIADFLTRPEHIGELSRKRRRLR
jgi:hypothetical protein